MDMRDMHLQLQDLSDGWITTAAPMEPFSLSKDRWKLCCLQRCELLAACQVAGLGGQQCWGLLRVGPQMLQNSDILSL